VLGPQKQRHFDRQLLVSLENLVPADNFYRHLDAKLDLSFIRDLVRDRYAACGRPSIDPIVFFRLELVLFFEGLRSERKLMESVALNLAQRWYAGYDFDEPLPDHSSLTRIRSRLGLSLFQQFFEHVVELCVQAGLVWGQELLFDGTKVRANAAMSSMRSRWSVEARAHLKDLFADDADDADASGPAPWALPGFDDHGETAPDAPDASSTAAIDPAAPVRLPFPGTVAEEADLAEKNRTQWRLLEEYRLDPERVQGHGTYQRLGDAQVSTTDPDATPLRPPDTGRLGYHDHYVVDGGKARIILQALVTPADVTDNQAMLDLLHRVRFRWQLQPKRAVADAKYGTIENIVGLEEAGICAYMPIPDLEHRTGYYGPSRFRYDPERDVYICPQDQELPFWRDKPTEDVSVYRGDAAICWKCPVRSECTDSLSGRIIQRSFFIDFIERVKGYHETEDYKKAMRKRQVWVEPLFGEAKDWHGLRRFRLRGLWKVNCEALLTAAGQNLKRWLRSTRRGRLQDPAGSLTRSVLHCFPSRISFYSSLIFILVHFSNLLALLQESFFNRLISFTATLSAASCIMSTKSMYFFSIIHHLLSAL
jgi:transposase